MKKLFLTLLAFGMVAGVFGQSLPVDTLRNSAGGTGTRTLDKDTVYILKGFVFVNDGQTLTIQPGTVIKGAPGQGANASALIVARGGKIIADGTPSQPIIFTAASDDVTNPNDIAATTQGLWGGLIVLGKAGLNTQPTEQAIEGIPTGEPRGLYGVAAGGTAVDNDNSGIIRYVSIRHGGTNIGANNEINGLTLGGVGSGTTIDYVEVFNNADDGVELFGGTVNIKHIIVAFYNDDGIDYDMGWRGKAQFVFGIQSDAAGSDRCGEYDGGTTPQTAQPYATPNMYNLTYIGRNIGGTGSQRIATYRDNAGGQMSNSIFYDQGRGVDIEIRGNSDDSYGRFLAGELKLRNNIFWNVAGNVANNMFTVSAIAGSFANAADSTAQVTPARDTVRKYFAAGLNTNVNPVLGGVDRTAGSNLLDPRPAVGGVAYQGLATYPANDPFFNVVSYKGAFGPTPNHWALGWTALDHYDYLAVPPSNVVTLTSASINGKLCLTKNNTYLLDGFVFVEAGDTLCIEAGTVIKGLPGQAGDASALIIARGGYIDAQGTADEPIIFTAFADDVANPDDLTPTTQGLWGGLIVLGKAGLNTQPTEQAIEGIPTGDPRGLFGVPAGGTAVNNDNSGIIKYVSLRHGGTNIGANNEINGLTLGGVGSGTTIDYVEIFANADDGIEWFGGTVNVKHALVAFCNDDAFDYDMGWRGKGQFWFTIQSADAGSDRCGEFDGGTTPQTGLPYATPVIFNATTLGRGATTGTTRMYTFRDNAGGKVYNSILSEQNRAVDIEIRGNSDDSYGRFQAGDLRLESNVFWDMASNNVSNQITIAPIAGSFTNPADSATQVAAARADVQAYFTTAKNKVANPKFVSVSRGAGLQLLDPRAVAFEVYDGLAAYPAGDAFFTPVEYKGAFGPDCADFWADKWTYMDFLRYFPATCADVTDVEDVLPAIASLVAYPNPNNGTFTLSADKVGNEPVEISVYNLVGAQILVRKVTPVAGMINETIELGNVAAGIYVLKARQGDQVTALRVDVK